MSNTVFVVSITALLFWCVSMYFFWRYRLQRIRLLQELSILSPHKRKKEKLGSQLKRCLFQLAHRLSNVGQKFPLFINEADLERKIALAGHPQGLNVAGFMGLRFVTVFAGLVAGNVLSLIGFGVFTQLLLILAGLFGPVIWIHHAAKKRQEQIGVDLPDFLDAMSVTLQAGTPLDPAMKQVVDSLDGPLNEELTRFMQELDLGVPREEAYTRLMKRNNCPELETLVVSLIQGSKLGVPIANTFRVMAEDIRATRIGKIKEKAAKSGPKVTLVTSMLILPGVILSVMGLLVLHFIYNSGFGKFPLQ
jgi:tight adherence protein C